MSQNKGLVYWTTVDGLYTDFLSVSLTKSLYDCEEYITKGGSDE